MLFLLAALLLLPSCSLRRPDGPLVQEEPPYPGRTSIHVADPGIVAQLLRGWHSVEQESWRWTEKHFAVALKVPSPGKPATLQLDLVLPNPLIAKLGAITLTAAINGATLPAQTFTKPGPHLYAQNVPPAAVNAEVVRIDFLLDKALPPNNIDNRELGVVVSSVGLH